MNILFFYESIGLGGQQTHTFNLIKSLSKMGHDVSWAYIYGHELRNNVEKYGKPHRLKSNWSKNSYKNPIKILLLLTKFFLLARKVRPDVVISGSGIGSFICGLVCRLLKIRHYRLIGCSLKQVEKTLYKYYEVIQIDRLIDGYFGWPAVFDELKEKRVPTGKLIEVQPGVDSDMFHPLSVEKVRLAKDKLKIKDKCLVIGWIGRISLDMQVKNTFEMAKYLKKLGFEEFIVLYVGGGSWLDELREKTEAAGLTDKSVFTDWVHMDEVNLYINMMDVVPMLEDDPHGGSIVREAMACAKVVISVDGKSGVQKAIMKSDNSILLDDIDYIAKAAVKVIELNANKSLCSFLGENARSFVEQNLSFEKQAKVILEAVVK